ncbi:AzlC family ABC transporter permease [Acidaminococcus fermentans]|uniref:4-azaleucine resistance probable transporter AzlC n=1 Tax=Acidaminococcus fermentans TaxID=905 RepID=A0A1H2VJ41_ACIFE|nr:AzlC family ABC transporter permease [Acidaminococcus fermentans]MCI6285724.1 AzlC family ABC transporter permease [Acidaminococcus fermentans]MCI7194998.1 AzlC family ABC transporter permease [Acidaminococcus fermentans]MDD6288078.1 AzlC family ABC transporter permease [Acidaminococcus fermentans]MDD7196437.1 AzlC family ABC transporter permease [Acidaminococcus fermentans]MDY2853123.1 AzlC family ABC transporter permease [Acidaminococcus fermentans]
MGYITRRVLQKDAPIILGYWVLGMACGMLGEKAGLNPFHMFIMSVLAFAGSSQFIGIAMMLQSASYISIALTILMVNLRYSLFTSTLAPLVARKSGLYTTLFSYGTTDETFALNLSSFQDEEEHWTHEEALGLDLLSMVVWAIANAFGCYASRLVHLDLSLVSYILTAMFLGIWSNYLKNRTMIITGLAAGVLAVLLSQVVPYKLHIVLASLIPSGLAAWLYLKHEKKTQPAEPAAEDEDSCGSMEGGSEA